MAFPDHPLDCFFDAGRLLHVAADGQMSLPSAAPRGQLLLPGSFNPLHRGHWELARVAEQIVGQPEIALGRAVVVGRARAGRAVGQLQI